MCLLNIETLLGRALHRLIASTTIWLDGHVLKSHVMNMESSTLQSSEATVDSHIPKKYTTCIENPRLRIHLI